MARFSAVSSWYSLLRSRHHEHQRLGIVLAELVRPTTQSQSFRASTFYSTDSEGRNLYPPHYLFRMPTMSPLMTEGRLIDWKHRVGDQVDAFDLVCDVETESLTEREDETCVMEVKRMPTVTIRRKELVVWISWFEQPGIVPVEGAC